MQSWLEEQRQAAKNQITSGENAIIAFQSHPQPVKPANIEISTSKNSQPATEKAPSISLTENISRRNEQKDAAKAKITEYYHKQGAKPKIRSIPQVMVIIQIIHHRILAHQLTTQDLKGIHQLILTSAKMLNPSNVI